MDELPACPQCHCVNTYPLGTLLVCPECAHEWVPGEESETSDTDAVIRDAVGNILTDGDTVTVVNDMKVKGSSNTLKVVTRGRNIRLVPGPGYVPEEGRAMVHGLLERVGEAHVELEMVDHIERTASGKFRALVCNLPPGS